MATTVHVRIFELRLCQRRGAMHNIRVSVTQVRIRAWYKRTHTYHIDIKTCNVQAWRTPYLSKSCPVLHVHISIYVHMYISLSIYIYIYIYIYTYSYT